MRNMKKIKFGVILVLTASLLLSGCASMNKTTKGAAVGTAAGGAMGAVIGKAAGNTALGAIIGATVGGATGAIIGREMDKQAAEIEQTVPDAKVERVGEGITVEFSSAVLFGFDQSDLSTDAKANLDKLVKVLNTYPDTNIEVQGHTDSKGSETYNQNLSEKRATVQCQHTWQPIRLTLSRITTKGFGETLPEYDNETEEGRAQNRRVEFLITANEKMIAEAAAEAQKKSKEEFLLTK
jgi:outer membrane protein OmpA-like peptidoglycan-associated protein